MTATMELLNHPAADALLDVFSQWLDYRRETVCSCHGETFDRIARDLGVSARELTGLVRSGPHSSTELPKMMELLRLDAAAIRRVQPQVMADMESAPQRAAVSM